MRHKIYLKAHQVGDLTPVDCSPRPSWQDREPEKVSLSVKKDRVLKPYQGPFKPGSGFVITKNEGL